jgi:hypothetical protein
MCGEDAPRASCTMQADMNMLDGRTGGGLGLSLLGAVASLSAALAALLMWTLLTSPTQIAVGVAEGPSALAGVLFNVVVDAVKQLLSWF